MRLWRAVGEQKVLVLCVAIIDVLLLYAIYAVSSSEGGFEGLLRQPGIRGSGLAFLAALGIGALLANVGALVVVYNEYRNNP